MHFLFLTQFGFDKIWRVRCSRDDILKSKSVRPVHLYLAQFQNVDTDILKGRIGVV